MIEYVNINNIDDRVLKRAANILEEGGLIAYPTDTNWGIGASTHSTKGIDKLRRLKGDFNDRTLTLICENISQVSEVAEVNNFAFKIIKKYTPGPFVFIVPAKNKIEKKINMKRLEIGIRIPANPVSVKLVEHLGVPIFSITASRRMTAEGWWDVEFAEENLFESGWEIEDINELDMIIDSGEPQPKVLSTVASLVNGEIEIIRDGVGKIEI